MILVRMSSGFCALSALYRNTVNTIIFKWDAIGIPHLKMGRVPCFFFCFSSLQLCSNDNGDPGNEDVFIGRVFMTAVVSLNIPESGLFADFVKQLKNDTCFQG